MGVLAPVSDEWLGIRPITNGGVDGPLAALRCRHVKLTH